MPAVTLTGHAYISVAGGDAEDFLQGLITSDVVSLPEGEARAAALLTPQGKILFDFLVSRAPSDSFLIETSEEQRDALVKRLALYKLRAAVEILPLAETQTTVTWDCDGEGVVDGRFLKAGRKILRRPGAVGNDTPAAYDALRIACGIVEAGKDYTLSDVFPHDILLDLSDGVSFRKGCFVGQEVVSRMQHRGTARKRPVILHAASPLPASGTELTAEGKPVGTLGTVAGTDGLAIVRIDRVADAMRAEAPILAGNVKVEARLPEWTGLDFPGDSTVAPVQ
ncbi:folate-binding protein YgfZ [Rhizobium sp. ARZ01]|uniref:CAF17-like 4Fe-4S cluster assembly/insertion protein YgfZ n=1 Tax=Rhizobium sp. ARZ01 TaxID=2769313 RepID=UPI00177E292D|nr:folate-binding protein YgfZ [Rhizobium sp. ARZ01]MBD9371657.1 folate-binding protein YgfZ [Rhizobium sp. ARZ01]